MLLQSELQSSLNNTTYNNAQYTERTPEDSLVFDRLRGVPPVDDLQVLGVQPAYTRTLGLVVLLHVGPQADGHPHTGRLLGPGVRYRDTLRHVWAANKKRWDAAKQRMIRLEIGFNVVLFVQK